MTGNEASFFLLIDGTTKKKKKGSAYQTISATHRVSINKINYENISKDKYF